ncbi:MULTISPECIES: tRNA pseudouridine(13) synthase TruD [unclassified Helicobacter]|uniref:tRNA pseudouridine(13) synthase TruD n=1 Tax=unclassified Helicobacter TaxID=2593540 RepID=UPI000CF0B653|nr:MULTISPECIES: tRNA pseudouridine(13) synthase TruD [unclassified Helicobacter]
MTQKIYALNHSPIDFYFSQNPRDFMVREIPLYPFSQHGEHLILNIRKKGLNTQDVIKILSSFLGCKSQEIGYAGLKDKSATTTQHFSINKKFTHNLSSHLKKLEDLGIKILSQNYHNNKIKLGHLKGNDFFIRLKRVTPTNATQIIQAIENIKLYGLPNYFGYQRFGKDKNNHLEGQKIIHKQVRYRNKTLQNFLISSYQSDLFNQWLSYRLKLSKIFFHFNINEIKEALKLENIFWEKEKIKSIKNQPHLFKIFQGDVLQHFPFGKFFHTQLQQEDIQRFKERQLSPTGPIYGKKIFLSQDDSQGIEERFLDPQIYVDGSRRYAWIWPENIHYRYIEQEAWLELEFFLPKGSYATILIEEVAHRPIWID